MRYSTQKLLNTIALATLFSGTLEAIEWTITCQGDARASSLAALDYTFGMEDDPDMLPMMYGEADPVCCDFPYWDDTSPACGGDGEQNVLLYAGCSGSATCYDVELGNYDGFQILSFDSGSNEYYNSVIMVNGYPCMPRDTQKIGVGVYNWNDNSNFGIANVNIPVLREEHIAYTLTSDEQKLHKSICSNDAGGDGDYTEQLNEIISNTAPNETSAEKLTNIDNREQALDDELNSITADKTLESILDTTDDTDTFQETFETTLTDSFDEYTDIFGFGGYGSAPAPITFSIRSGTYTLFDISNLDSSSVEFIRNTFLVFAYLWGFILVFRGN